MTWEDISLKKFKQLQNTSNFKEVVSILLSKDIDSIPLSELNSISEELSFLSTPPKPKMRDFQTRWKVTTSIDQMTAGQYIDYTNIKDDDYTQLLSVLLIPRNKKYNEDYNQIEHINLIEREISVQYAVDLIDFSEEPQLSTLLISRLIL